MIAPNESASASSPSPRALRPAPDPASGSLETSMWAMVEGFWPVVLRAPGEPLGPEPGGKPATGKEPARNAWGNVHPTPESLRFDFAEHDGRGVGLRLGPSGGWGDIEGDGEDWQEQILGLWGNAEPSTLGYDSRRGGHNMVLPVVGRPIASIPTGTKFIWSPEVCDLEIRLNGKDVQSQSVIPPTITDDYPRRWRGPWRLEPLPPPAISTLERLWAEDQRRRKSANHAGQQSRARRSTEGTSSLSTIDAYNQSAGIDGIIDILKAHGWSITKQGADGVIYVAHPDATARWSASIGWCGPRLYCWSNNTAFPVLKPLDAFDVYRVLEHGDDFRKALVSLREQGYGMPRPTIRINRPSHEGDGHGTATGPPAGGDPDGPADDTNPAPPRQPHQPFATTDLGNCERFVRDHGEITRHVGPWKKWLAWDGRRWKVDETGEVVRLAKQTVRGIAVEASLEPDSDRFKALIGWASKSEDAKRIGAMIQLAQSENGIAISHQELDSDPWSLNVRNGTLDLKSGALRPHTKLDLITHLAPVEYDPDASCPLWEEELRIVFNGDSPLISFFQRLCGYWLTGVVREQVLPIAYGSGRNGKSTILGTLLRILGNDYAYEADPGLIMQRSNEDHPTEKAALFGKRLVSLSETESGKRLNEALVKRLTGKEQITARRMREDPWSFWPSHKLVLATNHRPEIRGTDVAIWRRVLLIPFTVTISPETEITDFADRLAAEDAGILAWAVRGCLAWQEIGLSPPESIKAATRDYRDSQDVLSNFIAERCIVLKDAKVRSGELYTSYCSWTKENGESTMGSRQFYASMEERGFQGKIGRSNRKFIHGIGLRREEDDSDHG